MTPVKPQISKFKTDKCLAKMALTCYGGFSHERLLSESIRPYMLAYYLFLYALLLSSTVYRRGNHRKQIF
jgi:hypothetical protein